jgi:glycerol-3-phosphate acyltransferase PlsY
MAFPVLLVIFAGTIWVTRIVSLASLLTAACFPLTIWVLYPDRPVLLVFALLGVPLVFWAHRTNIRRLMRGEEPRTTIGKAPTQQERDGGGGKGEE